MESSSSLSNAHLRIRTLTKTNSASSSFRLRSPSLNCLRLRRIFDLFDKNGDGFITADELCRALGLLGLEAELAELESTMEAFVEPGCLGLRFEDFVRLHQTLGDAIFGGESGGEDDGGDDSAASAQEEEDLSEAFKVFDEDGDGFISARELQAVLGKLGMAEGDEISRVESMITSVDRNCDGRVDFFEFKDMMRSVIVRSS